MSNKKEPKDRFDDKFEETLDDNAMKELMKRMNDFLVSEWRQIIHNKKTCIIYKQ